MKKHVIIMLLTLVLCLGATPAFGHESQDDCRQKSGSNYACKSSESGSKGTCGTPEIGGCSKKGAQRRHRLRGKGEAGCYRPCDPVPSEPGQDPVEPGQDPVEPGQDPVEPGQDPVEPDPAPFDPTPAPVEPGMPEDL